MLPDTRHVRCRDTTGPFIRSERQLAYTLIVLIFVAADATHPAATVPLTLGSFKTAAACQEAADQVVRQSILDSHEQGRISAPNFACPRLNKCPAGRLDQDDVSSRGRATRWRTFLMW